MAFGTRKLRTKDVDLNLKADLNCPFAFALGPDYKTNRSMLLWISPSGAQFQMPREDPVPNLTAFEDLDFSFRLPGDQTTWTCKADIERIFAYDPHEHPVYGMTLKLKGFSDEQLMQMYQMIRAKLGMPALPE